MALPAFTSFFPTVRRWINTSWRQEYRLIVDNDTGAPVGIMSPNANGPEGIWAPVPLSAAQIIAPDAIILADINATFQLNESPYTRYRSNGTQLEPLGSETADGSNFPGAVLQIVPPGTPQLTIGVDSYAVIYSPFTVQNAAGVLVQGRLDVVARPA